MSMPPDQTAGSIDGPVAISLLAVKAVLPI
jgi:hypothetical protein